MNPLAEKIALNEALFREVNERIAQFPRGPLDVGMIEFVCECGRSDCHDRLRVSASRYEQVRQNPHQFLIAPGHMAEGVETLVEENPETWVVEKIGETRAIVRETDPRD